MSYVDAKKISDAIHVVERKDGKRIFQKFPANYVFYAKNKNGKATSIYGDPVTQFRTSSWKKFQSESGSVRRDAIFESDINPVFRFLEDNYKGEDAPDIHIAFFDIEVDFDPAKGFSSPEDPYAPINAISIYQSWTGMNLTYTLKPDTLSWDEAADICDSLEDCFLCQTEEELFEKTLQAFDDADVLSGWNSTSFDIPYIIRRLEKIKNREATKAFCLWDQYPAKRTFEQYGKEQITYDLAGRVHLDYLDLYRKHTYHELHSYSLDNVGEYEVGEKKTAYEGSLDRLYKYDYKLFLEYNKQDTMLLVKIDEKNDFINMSNALAHENCVLLNTTLGSVALIEQAIVNEIHDKGMVAPNKKQAKEGNNSVAGAFVANPVKGLHDWIGSVDINSLYPSVIRSLNMSPETIMGQFRLDRTLKILQQRISETKNVGMGEAWGDFFGVIEYNMVQEKSQDMLTVDLEDGSVVTQTGAEWYDMIYTDGSNLCLSANGTLFRTDIKGIIPGLLERWYAERVAIRAEAKDIFAGIDKLQTEAEKAEAKRRVAFLDQRQLIKKILLNSLYGAVLNPHCRFFDQRMGQSVTLTGRCITKHMASKINEIFTGEYDLNGKCIIYGDTDSAYFSAYPAFCDVPDFDWSKENVMALYDHAAEEMNSTFPGFMVSAFHTTPENGAIIEAGREVCATKGLFIKKKRYALMCYDVEGRRFDTDGKPGKLKAMGIDLKRADTPKTIQDFLERVLIKVLTGSEETEIQEYVRDFREHFQSWHGWEKGTPKRVNGLTKKVDLEEKVGKIAMAGHQRASKNWNELKKLFNDKYSLSIQDGSKVIVCKLKNNPLNVTSVAYPTEQADKLPDWFRELPFDHDAMEDALIDSKLDNLVGVLKWEFNRDDNKSSFSDLFSL